ncbi:NUDIX hydrolase [Rhodococcus artemisiae]|uniref:NUDIX hydrolase n=1 Tax=Rhodococcus artemisiae TaxID=714159 RepID=A0ABU7L841_9NOCA|nr:NUDIX hydrolase [Rhodococcus artemisiae]MEE2057711.1 NUDIX hydrolase [Rhodococcus artemisiae]
MTKLSDESSPEDILAAGTVLWRPGEGGLELALVHRPKYDDWTFPKGKLDPGETPIVAALRETEEETGFRAVLGRGLGRVTYSLPGSGASEATGDSGSWASEATGDSGSWASEATGDSGSGASEATGDSGSGASEATGDVLYPRKQVDYWTARCESGDFVANDEVDALRWVSPDTAFDELTYSMDHTVLRRFLELPIDTRTVLVVRHAKAGSRRDYDGDDRARPLEEKGRRQAAALVPQLSAFGADTLFSADRARCTQTIEPLAHLLGVDIALEPSLSEEDYTADPALARKRIADVIESGTVPVLCSQGGVIPNLLQWWSEESGFDLPEGRTRKASTWILSFHCGRLVAAEYLDTPLAPGQA